MGEIGIVKSSEGGFIDNFLLEGKVGGLVGIKLIQLLYSGERQGGFGRGNVVSGCFGLGWWCLLVTLTGITIGESTTPGNMVVDIG